MRRLLLQITIALLLVTTTSIIVWRQSAAQVKTEIIVVHTGESLVLQYNPDTHEVRTDEGADGNKFLSIRPKD